MRFFTLGLILTLTPGTSPAAPPAKEKAKDPVYFPADVGAEWVYESEDGEGLEIHKVTFVEEKKDAKVFTVVERTQAKGSDRKRIRTTKKYKVSGTGLFLLADGGTKYDPPECQLKLPHVDSGKWDNAKPGLLPSVIFEAFGPSRIKLSVGKYDAVCVEKTMYMNNLVAHEYYWFAPDVGIVKISRQFITPQWKTWVLKSFTPGKTVKK